jgi:hypothetical protein
METHLKNDLVIFVRILKFDNLIANRIKKAIISESNTF